MRLADVLETIPACEEIRVENKVGVIYNGTCCDFMALCHNDECKYRSLLRKVALIRAEAPACVVIGLKEVWE